MVAIDHFIKVGDQVFNRAAISMTERNAAIHTAGSLGLQFIRGEIKFKFTIIGQPLLNRSFAGVLALKINKTGRLSH